MVKRRSTAGWRASTIVVACCVFALETSAQPEAAGATPSRTGDAMAVFREALDADVGWTVPTGYVYRYRLTSFSTMTQAELDRAEGAISGLPDHPNRVLLGIQRRRLATPEVVEFHVWWNGPNGFRYSETWVQGAEPVPGLTVDTVFSSDRVWMLTRGHPAGGQVAILDPGAPPPEGRDLASTASSVERRLSLLMEGGLCSLWTSGFDPVEASWEGRTLLGTSVNPEGVRQTVVLEPGDQGRRWVVSELRSSADAERPWFTWRYRFSGWRVTEAGLAASQVERVGGDGRILERLEWIDAGRMTPGEFDTVTKIPTLESTDVLRGDDLFTSVFDYRPSANTLTSLTPSGVQVVPLPARSGALPRWCSGLGWAAAGVLVAVLVGIRVWRSRVRVQES